MTEGYYDLMEAINDIQTRLNDLKEMLEHVYSESETF